MYLIVGLGNPGKEYQNNRHNVGYLVVDQITKSEKENIKFKILKPNQFMNNSGQQVAKEANYYKIKPIEIFVIHDDVDLEFGKVRISFGSGSGGHNGVKSIIEHLKTQDFWRVRVGVGRPRLGQETDNYVLEDFPSEQKKDLDKIIDETTKIVLKSISDPKEETLKILSLKFE